jgi:very-short-patch-repair endonuclease
LSDSVLNRPSRQASRRRLQASATHGHFIVDFLARQAKLIVEIDGDAYHASRVQADAARERKLVRAGYVVLRIPASLVERDLAGAVGLVSAALE